MEEGDTPGKPVKVRTSQIAFLDDAPPKPMDLKRALEDARVKAAAASHASRNNPTVRSRQKRKGTASSARSGPIRLESDPATHYGPVPVPRASLAAGSPPRSTTVKRPGWRPSVSRPTQGAGTAAAPVGGPTGGKSKKAVPSTGSSSAALLLSRLQAADSTPAAAPTPSAAVAAPAPDAAKLAYCRATVMPTLMMHHLAWPFTAPIPQEALVGFAHPPSSRRPLLFRPAASLFNYNLTAPC